MKKYLYIYKMTLIESLQYLSEIFFGLFSYLLVIWVFLNLWQYIYSDSTNLINGYSIKQMIWYVIITELLWYGIRNKDLTKQISNDIKSGTIAYQMNKPYNYLGFIFMNSLGKITIRFIIYILLSITIGLILIGPIPNFNIIAIPFFLIITILATIINNLIRIIISVLSFWIEDAQPFVWIYEKMILVLGITFPLEMFPIWLQGIIKYSPVFVTTYGPAKILINFSLNTFYNIIIIQLLYIIITIVIIALMYRRGVKKLNVNGG